MNTVKLTTIKTWYTSTGYDSNRTLVSPELAMILALDEGKDGWYLPTEVVVREPRMVVPKQARYWMVDAEEVRTLTGMTEAQWPDMLETREYATKVRRVNKSRSSNHAYIIEDHNDRGDDGHTSYYLSGYHMLTPADFTTYLAYMKENIGWAYKGTRYTIVEAETYCDACKTSSPSESWVPDAPGGWDRCPNCGMC